MCGDRARTASTSSSWRAVEVEEPVLGSDLVGVRRALARLVPEHGRRGRKHLVEELDRELGRARVHVRCIVVRLEEERPLRRDRPGVEVLHRSMDRDPRLDVPGHDRPLDRGRPAPARKQRRMDVEPQPLVEQRLRDQLPVRDHDRDGRAEVEAGLELLRLNDVDAESLRGLLGRRSRELASPSRGCVGPGEQGADLVPCGEAFEDVRAEGRGCRDRDLRAHLGSTAPRTGCGLSVASAPLRDSASVRSMISTPSRWSSSCWTTRAVVSSSSSVTAFPFSSKPSIVSDDRALDGNVHLAQRKTSFVVGRRVLGALRDDRVDEDAVLAVVDEDEDAPQHADLRRREADSLRLVHERRHALGEAQEVVVELLDLPRLHPENGIPVLPDPRERYQPARFALEPLVLGGVQLLAMLVVMVMVVVVLVIVVVVVVVHGGESSPPRPLSSRESGCLSIELLADGVERDDRGRRHVPTKVRLLESETEHAQLVYPRARRSSGECPSGFRRSSRRVLVRPRMQRGRRAWHS